MVKNLPANAGDIRDMDLIPGLGRSPGEVFLPGESHGRRSLVGYSPRVQKESDTTEILHVHFHFQGGHRLPGLSKSLRLRAPGPGVK